MISEAELAQMKERPPLYKDTLRLIREVEELTKENAGLREIGTRLLTIRDDKMKTIEELRAALREIVELEGAESPAGIKARAALGEK